MLCAGSSAFLLIVPTEHPGLWVLVCLALAPLFYRLSRVPMVRAARLGFLFGLSYFGVTLSGTFVAHPLHCLVLLATGTCLLTAYGWLTAFACVRAGFNPLVFALLWIGLEASAIIAGFGNGLIGSVHGMGVIVAQVSMLFGTIFVSFIIASINLLFIIVARTSFRLRDTTIVRDAVLYRGVRAETATVPREHVLVATIATRAPPASSLAIRALIA